MIPHGKLCRQGHCLSGPRGSWQAPQPRVTMPRSATTAPQLGPDRPPVLTVRDGLDVDGLGDTLLRGGLLHRFPADFGFEKGVDQGGLPQAALPWGENGPFAGLVELQAKGGGRLTGPETQRYPGVAPTWHPSVGGAQWGRLPQHTTAGQDLVPSPSDHRGGQTAPSVGRGPRGAQKGNRGQAEPRTAPLSCRTCRGPAEAPRRSSAWSPPPGPGRKAFDPATVQPRPDHPCCRVLTRRPSWEQGSQPSGAT